VKYIYVNSFKLNYIRNDVVFKEGSISDSVFIVNQGEFVLNKSFDIQDMYKKSFDILDPSRSPHKRKIQSKKEI